jgi:hypothetical protein
MDGQSAEPMVFLTVANSVEKKEW